jgi:hypothetical protein
MQRACLKEAMLLADNAVYMSPQVCFFNVDV